MENDKPDFYLISTDYKGLEEPRRSWILKKIDYVDEDGIRGDIVLVKVEPPIQYPIGGEKQHKMSISEVVIAPRHSGCSLVKPKEWPVYVELAIVKETIYETAEQLQPDSLRVLMWAEAYPTYEKAKKISDEFTKLNENLLPDWFDAEE